MLTYAQLERKLSTGYVTIKANSEELEAFGAIEIKKYDKHDANGRPYFEIKITKNGLEFLNKL